MKKILLSVATLAIVGVVAAGATTAFFSDTETSSGNTFTAGAIDLQIDNESYYNLDENGNMIPNDGATWDLADLNDGEGPGPDGAYLFFDFADLKPGDIGEDTISFHVTDNPSWLCADVNITKNDDVSSTEPELEDGDDQEDANDDFDGELAQNLNFMFWADDGDNVLEVDEQVLTQGPASDVLDADPYRTYALADSQTNVWADDTDPIDGSQTYYLGKAWCFGDISEDRVDDGEDTGPDQRGPGVTCNGASVNNTTQTDSLMGDIRFRAVQSRNNDGFVCEPLQDDDFGQGGNGGGEEELVGALLSSYEAPENDSCDLFVDPDNADDDSNTYATIQEAITAADTEQTICVVDGSFDGGITIDKDITLAGDGADDTSTINGTVAINANGATLEGFDIDGRVTVDANNVTVSDNLFNTGTGRGVVTSAGVVTGLTVDNNVFDGYTTGVYLEEQTTGSVVTHNDFENNTAGIGGVNPSDSTDVLLAQFNDFQGNDEAVGIVDDGDLSSVVITHNNIVNDGGPTDINLYDVSGDPSNSVDASNNWWGDADGTDDVSDSTLINVEPEASSVYPHN